jgi:hypothetical protein
MLRLMTAKQQYSQSGDAMKKTRMKIGASLFTASQLTGVALNTICRFENKKTIRVLDYIKLCQWIEKENPLPW